MELQYHDGVSEVVANLSHLTHLMSKGKPLFINNAYAKEADIKCLVKNINKGLSIGSKETEYIIFIYA